MASSRGSSVAGRFWSPGTVLAALILATIVVLPFCPPFHPSDVDFVFEATVSSSQRGLVQLFFDVGRGFNEADSRYVAVAGDGMPRTIDLTLPHGRYGALRFDPLDRSGVITVSGAAVRDYRGRIVLTLAPRRFRPLHQIRRLEITGSVLRIETDDPADDPNLWIDLDAPFELGKVAGSEWETYAAAVMLVWALTLFAARVGVAVAAPLGAQFLRRPRRALALVALAAVLVSSYPVAFLGRSFVSPNNGALLLYNVFPTLPGYTSAAFEDNMGSDTGAVMWWHLPVAAVERQAILHDHELPLWNRYDLCGQPLLGQGQTMLGDPLHWAAAILGGGSPVAWDLRFLVAKWLFAFGVGVSVLLLTADVTAAAVLTVASVYVGFFGFRIDHPAIFSVGYAPWLLYAWLQIRRAPTRAALWTWVAALAGADWLELNSGTVKEAYMLAVTLNLTGVLLVVAEDGPWGGRVRRLGAAAWGTLVVVLLAAPFWLTFLDALNASMNSYEQPAAQQLAFGRLIGFFEDLFARQASPGEHLVAPAANVLALLGVLWAAAGFRAVASQRAARVLAFAAMIAAALVFSVVPEAWIVAVPFLRNVRHIDNTFSCVMLVLVLPLAGCGVSAALISARFAIWRRRAFGVALGASALIACYFGLQRPAHFSSFFLAYAVSLLLGSVLLHVCARRLLSRRDSSPAACILLALGLASLLWRQGQYLRTAFDSYVFNPQVRVKLDAPSTALTYIQQNTPAPARTLGLGLNFVPGFNQEHLIEAIYGVDALRSRELVSLLLALGLSRVEDFADMDLADQDAAHRAAYDALNVEYFLNTPGQLPPDSPWEHSGDWDLAVYRSRTFWPRAYYAARVETYRDLSQLAARLRSARGPVAAVAAGDRTVDPAVTALAAHPVDEVVVPASRYWLSANRTAFDIQAPGPGVAVLVESWFPADFHATVNGREAPYFRVNHAFKGVYLPSSGSYRVEFSYWPRHLTLSLRLAAMGVALGVATILLVWLDGKIRGRSALLG